jgi:hypothetical protein
MTRTHQLAEFCPKNETGFAIAKLEMEKYYQGKCSVDEYIDEFRELVERVLEESLYSPCKRSSRTPWESQLTPWDLSRLLVDILRSTIGS